MSQYRIHILTNKEFDTLPAHITRGSQIDDSLGFADPKTGDAYVRHTASHDLNKYLINHEMEELMTAHSTHEDENGIRHKKGGFLRALFNIAAPFVAPFVGGGGFKELGSNLLGQSLGAATGFATGGPVGAGIGAASSQIQKDLHQPQPQQQGTALSGFQAGGTGPTSPGGANVGGNLNTGLNPGVAVGQQALDKIRLQGQQNFGDYQGRIRF